MAQSRKRIITRLEGSGHRFSTRRMQHALVRADARMLDDPARAQALSLSVGAVLTVIVVAACAVLAFLRPQGALDGAAILTVRETGALYVRVDDVVHPVPNLASARLVAGAPATPTVISAQSLAEVRRGPMVGIAGAPAAIDDPLPAAAAHWTVCDAPGVTTVLIGASDAGRIRLGDTEAVLVSPAAEGAATTFLLHRGRRARVDLRDGAVVRALRLEGRTPRVLSRSLIDLLPEDPPITAPAIPRAGSPGPAALGGMPIGTVVRLVRADTTEHFVVLSDGLQRIGEVAADLIRLSVPQPHSGIPTIAATALAATPAVETLAVGTFPTRVAVTDAAVLCARWAIAPGADRPQTALWRAEAGPSGPAVTALAQHDGAGPNVDAVEVPAGRSLFARAVGIGGSGGDAGPLYYVTDLGVTFGVRDAQAAQQLGLPAAATAAPWPVLARMPRGPELSRDRALLVRDTVAAPEPG